MMGDSVPEAVVAPPTPPGENYFEGFDILDDVIDATDELDFNEADDLDQLAKMDESIKGILERGTDINKYSKQVERELQRVSAQQLGAYEDQAEALTTLHSEIEDCDSVLARMEDLLSKFKFSLGTINKDIQELQDTLLNMSIDLNNHTASMRCPLLALPLENTKPMGGKQLWMG
ncbi:hypothetical protein EV182_005472 [Spiromyces aspiralis]|uniref:Uncharacterized protein n=1 Tax=Spiromyces aspiralis TaxID=68401 RepID=A0ACC1HQX5_9FUNG|nr:hypothetical protein EV182_005472 [Spiromyces aspiralis]